MALVRCKTCVVDGCTKHVRCKDLCAAHYARLVKSRNDPVRPDLTHERLLEVLDYDAANGRFSRKCGHRKDLYGAISETDNGNGYPRVTVDGHRYHCHRLAWFYVHGVFPKDEIDHINGDRGDYRLANLRVATRRKNAQNMRRPQVSNKSGHLGVSYDKSRDKWVARIRTIENYKMLGRFDTKEEASAAYITAKRRYHEGCTI